MGAATACASGTSAVIAAGTVNPSSCASASATASAQNSRAETRRKGRCVEAAVSSRAESRRLLQQSSTRVRSKGSHTFWSQSSASSASSFSGVFSSFRMSRHSFFLALLLLLTPSGPDFGFFSEEPSGLLLAEAKKVASPVRLSGPRRENHWRYLSKFGYAIGEGSFEVRFQLYQPKTIAEEANVQLEIYLDEAWNDVEAEEDICARSQFAKQVRNVTLGPGSEWTEWINGTLTQNIRPHIWYFVLSDCHASLQNFTHRLKYEFHAFQEDESEFSVEMRGMLTANILFLLAFSIFIYWFVRR
eukprot:TRINITY_DN50189_c0_g1_i1.p1 TRINITY_DN50189_c0_g1~~TRINITY_DN50189_c0_g1_i1.p1  ORF type:complete len:302 (+),score=55.35 TRINITY_DN50189_c0_g1_i1:220-1125(+)